MINKNSNYKENITGRLKRKKDIGWVIESERTTERISDSSKFKMMRIEGDGLHIKHKLKNPCDFYFK